MFKAGAGDPSDVRMDDLRQGRVGDCYLIASLQVLADRDPGVLRGMIVANANGTYTVTFADGVAVTVVPDFPADDHGLAFARNGTGAGDDRELWPMIIEKAYAQKHGGWPEIDVGYVSDTIEELSGRKATAFAGRDATVRELADRLAHGEIMTAGTLPDTALNILTGRSPGLPEPFHRGDPSDLYARLYPPTRTSCPAWTANTAPCRSSTLGIPPSPRWCSPRRSSRPAWTP